MLTAPGRKQALGMVPPGTRGLFRQHYPILSKIWLCLDVAVALVCLLVVTQLRLGEFPTEHRVLAVVVSLLMVLAYSSSGLFHNLRMRPMSEESRLLLSQLLLVLGALLVIGYVTGTHRHYSLELVLQWALACYAGQVVLHGLVRAGAHAARRRAMNIRRALLIGSPLAVSRFAKRVADNSWLGIQALGYVDCTDRADVHAQKVHDSPQADTDPVASKNQITLPSLGTLHDVPRLIERHDIDQVYLVLPIEMTHRVTSTTRALLNLDVEVNWVPDLSIFQLISHSVRQIDGQPILCLTDSPLATGQATLKRLEDVALSSLLLIAMSPLMLAIAIAVKLSSPGPILFKQERPGLYGKTFKVWKFRTMFVEEREETPQQAIREDPRVTPVGRLLRRWSLDELPQLFQVLQGKMSIVGPRPHPVWLNEQYRATLQGYMQRHRIKPGITGWAQVNGWRGETESEEKMEMRVRHDLYYVTRWSIWFDLKIILMTATVVFRGQNAY